MKKGRRNLFGYKIFVFPFVPFVSLSPSLLALLLSHDAYILFNSYPLPCLLPPSVQTISSNSYVCSFCPFRIFSSFPLSCLVLFLFLYYFSVFPSFLSTYPSNSASDLNGARMLYCYNVCLCLNTMISCKLLTQE